MLPEAGDQSNLLRSSLAGKDRATFFTRRQFRSVVPAGCRETVSSVNIWGTLGSKEEESLVHGHTAREGQPVTCSQSHSREGSQVLVLISFV